MPARRPPPQGANTTQQPARAGAGAAQAKWAAQPGPDDRCGKKQAAGPAVKHGMLTAKSGMWTVKRRMWTAKDAMWTAKRRMRTAKDAMRTAKNAMFAGCASFSQSAQSGTTRGNGRIYLQILLAGSKQVKQPLSGPRFAQTPAPFRPANRTAQKAEEPAPACRPNWYSAFDTQPADR